MANDIKGKVWDLDTAGLISTKPVCIEGIAVTFKTASAGTVTLNQVTEVDGQRTAGSEVFQAKSLGATSAAVDSHTFFWPIKVTVPNLWLSTVADIDKLLIYTR